MKRLKLSLFAVLGALAIVSCGGDGDSDDVLGTGNNGGGDASTPTIRITEGGSDDDIFVAEATGSAGTTTEARVIFTTTDKKQRRLYVTRSELGGTPEPFVIPELGNRATKADGSIDIDGDTRSTLDFTFNLDVPTDANGEIVYNFWSTTGKGDFRDASKRLLLGVGSITVKVGTGVNPASAVRSFSDIKLFAPDSEGKFDTFFSLLTGQAHKIIDGPEFRALWDFGYYYGASGVSANHNASLVSVQDFDATFGFPVEGLEPGDDEEDAENETLNQAYFSESNRTSADFDAVSISSDLDDIIKSTATNIINLSEGDVIEFVDNYGDKGLILVKEIKPGFDNDDFIVIDIKVQPAQPMEGKSMM